jgi:hypothetical protein
MTVCRLFAVVATLGLLAATAAAAQTPAARVESWLDYQRNDNGTAQWKLDPRLYVPFALGGGWTFTQRIDVPLVYTDDKGSANPAGGWAFGFGNALVEEIFETPELAADLRLRGSVRVVFPTGKDAPFGSSQYQWAPGAGLTYDLPQLGRGVTLEPFVRYFSGFAATAPNVKLVREWDLYPTATVVLGSGWSLLLWPENPIQYNREKRTWFVPLDILVAVPLAGRWQFGVGGAYALGSPRDPPYRWIVDARLSRAF